MGNSGIKSRQFVFHRVTSPIFNLTQTVVAVMSPAAHHGDLTPSVVVIVVFKQLRSHFHGRANGGLRLAAHKLHMLRIGEIALKDVANHVNDTGRDLVLRQRKEKFRVNHRDQRTNFFARGSKLESIVVNHHAD